MLAFALTATPAAFIGGGIHLPAIYYKPLVGLLLWAAAARLLWQPKAARRRGPMRAAAIGVSLPAGAVLGLLAGLTGTGGGIFLSPLIILNRLGGAAAHVGRSRRLHLAQFDRGAGWQFCVGRPPAARAAVVPCRGRCRRTDRHLAGRRAAAAAVAAADARAVLLVAGREAALYLASRPTCRRSWR